MAGACGKYKGHEQDRLQSLTLGGARVLRWELRREAEGLCAGAVPPGTAPECFVETLSAKKLYYSAVLMVYVLGTNN